jgi:hypothetical protein
LPQPKREIRLPDGRLVSAYPVPYQTGGEHWNEYLTDEGCVLRVKLIATEILRIEGEYDAGGQPVHFLSSTNILTVSAPENLRKGEGQ